MDQKNILVTFARQPIALDLARQLHSAGHRIIVAESIKYFMARYSNTVSKSYIVPSPSTHPSSYLEALLKIVQDESIDLLLPIFEESACIAKYRERFPASCKIFCPPFDLFHELHHKWLFQCKLGRLGLPPVPSKLISDQEELAALKFDTPFLLKACYSRASQSITKLYPGQKIPKIRVDAQHPVIAQKWLEGEKYCSYSICHDGKVFAHSLYPVQYAIGGHSCLMFESVEHAGIYEWVRTFARLTGYTGQIAFDFIVTQDKQIYAIECNPRATSGLYLFDSQDRLDRAFLAQNEQPIFPKVGVKKQIGMGMLVYGWKKSSLPNNRWSSFLRDYTTIRDVVYHPDDLRPSFFKPFVFALLLKKAWQSKLPLPKFFTYDHHWNGEEI